MFPSKSMMEYLAEMNRLFPRNESEDPQYSFNPYHSPYQSAMVNRSSSSTDSTSPESYPELLFRTTDSPRPLDTPTHIPNYYTAHRRQRPIVGRKILGSSQNTQKVLPVDKMETDFNFWQPEEPLAETPPESTLHPKSFYELFPMEHKFDFKTPVKTEPRMYRVSPNMPNISPTFSNRSPPSYSSPAYSNYFNPSQSSQRSHHSPLPNNPAIPQSPTWSNSSQRSMTPSFRHNPDFSSFSRPHNLPKYTNMGATSSTEDIPQTKMCTFCRKNGETPVVYMTHSVKELIGKRHVVTCPILRSHVCQTCGESGDNAHTITYCPVLRSTNNGRPLQSTTITLKNTRIKSNGRRRY